jgi:hypothetical protein
MSPSDISLRKVLISLFVINGLMKMIWHYCFLIKVTEEDIALSFLEEENPLPESDQNFPMASELCLELLEPMLISSSYASLSRLDKKSAEGQDDHPLRVLSQECLTVVSTFAGRENAFTCKV